VRDRLAGLLPDDALQDALKDLGARGDHRSGRAGQPARRASARDGVGAELTEHLGYRPGQALPGGAGNARDGSTRSGCTPSIGGVLSDSALDQLRRAIAKLRAAVAAG
jgi:hypothetical protein